MRNADCRRIRMSALAVSALGLGACSSKSEPPPENVGSQGAALSALTNQIGRLTTSGNSERRTTFSYDALGRAKATGHAMEGAEYVYTSQYGYPKRTLGPSDGELGTVLQSTRLPDGEMVTYEYDGGGGQQKITAGGAPIVTQVRRNAKGQTTSVVHGNGVESQHRYNDQGDLRLRQIVSTHRPTGRVLQAYEYDFDAAGNVKQIRDYCNPDTDQCPCDPTPGASCLPDRLSRAFDYDQMDRLVQMRAPDGMSIAGLPRGYAYDAIDNLTQKDGVSQTYGTNGKPHALTRAGDVTYSYDPNGNLVSTSAGLTVAWNAQNMPVLTINNGQKVRKQFVGEAVWKKVEGDTTTLYLPSIRIENGRLRKYYGGFAERDPDAGGALRFYHGDHLGSSTLVTDAGGDVVHRAAYLPYGQVDPTFTRQNTFDPKYRFNFKEAERTSGLLDYGARMYNPATGRWISPDTVTTDGLNRYAYLRNNPLKYIDPTGHSGKKIFRDDTEEHQIEQLTIVLDRAKATIDSLGKNETLLILQQGILNWDANDPANANTWKSKTGVDKVISITNGHGAWSAFHGKPNVLSADVLTKIIKYARAHGVSDDRIVLGAHSNGNPTLLVALQSLKREGITLRPAATLLASPNTNADRITQISGLLGGKHVVVMDSANDPMVAAARGIGSVDNNLKSIPGVFLFRGAGYSHGAGDRFDELNTEFNRHGVIQGTVSSTFTPTKIILP